MARRVKLWCLFLIAPLCFLAWHWHSDFSAALCRMPSPETLPPHSRSHRSALNFDESIRRLQHAMQASLYRYDRAHKLAVMQLSNTERNRSYRVEEARKWLRTQRLVVGAALRNAEGGLASTRRILYLLSGLFQSVDLVVVENDSRDKTRQILHDWTKGVDTPPNLSVTLLGCNGTVNSRRPCHIDISYPSSGKKHSPGQMGQTHRSIVEESVDRGLVMGAIRNLYLDYIYRYFRSADLLLVLEADIDWSNWDADDVAQGLYYFKSKPRLDSLCALGMYIESWGDNMQDPCTLIFHSGRYYFADANESESAPFLDRNGIQPNELYRRYFGLKGGQFKLSEDLPTEPLKVASCFQGVTFYRLSSMRQGPNNAEDLYYRYSEGEWHCEHTTLSMQLRENYLDTRMRPRAGGHPLG